MYLYVYTLIAMTAAASIGLIFHEFGSKVLAVQSRMQGGPGQVVWSLGARPFFFPGCLDGGLQES